MFGDDVPRKCEEWLLKQLLNKLLSHTSELVCGCYVLSQFQEHFLGGESPKNVHNIGF